MSRALHTMMTRWCCTSAQLCSAEQPATSSITCKVPKKQTHSSLSFSNRIIHRPNRTIEEPYCWKNNASSSTSFRIYCIDACLPFRARSKMLRDMQCRRSGKVLQHRHSLQPVWRMLYGSKWLRFIQEVWERLGKGKFVYSLPGLGLPEIRHNGNSWIVKRQNDFGYVCTRESPVIRRNKWKLFCQAYIGGLVGQLFPGRQLIVESTGLQFNSQFEDRLTSVYDYWPTLDSAEFNMLYESPEWKQFML